MARHSPEADLKRKEAKKAGHLPPKVWTEILTRFRFTCAYCGSTDCELTKDHVIPISRGGTHTEDNVVPACRPCNSSKQDKTPDEWWRQVRMKL